MRNLWKALQVISTLRAAIISAECIMPKLPEPGTPQADHALPKRQNGFFYKEAIRTSYST